MSAEAIGTGIKANLGNVTGLKRVYAPNETVGALNEFPCAVIRVEPGSAKFTMGGDGAHYRHAFSIDILDTAQDLASSIHRLLDFRTATGDNSVMQKLWADKTLGGSASTILNVTMGVETLVTWGDTQYLCLSFDLEVYE